MKSKPTKRPWKADPQNVAIILGDTRIPNSPIVEARWQLAEVCKANRDLILRAVNSHDALVDILENKELDQAHDFLSELLEDPGAENEDIREAAVDLCEILVEYDYKRELLRKKIKAALKQAEESK